MDDELAEKAKWFLAEFIWTESQYAHEEDDSEPVYNPELLHAMTLEELIDFYENDVLARHDDQD